MGATNVVYARQISGQYRKIAAIQNRQEHLAGRRRQPFRSATLNTAKQGRSGWAALLCLKFHFSREIVPDAYRDGRGALPTGLCCQPDQNVGSFELW